MDPARLLATTHRFFAVECNNAAWAAIAKPDPESALELAWASLFHWRACGTAVNVARAHGTVSRAYSVAGEGELALEHAGRYGGAAAEEGYEDWDAAFAALARARALGLLGREAEYMEARSQAEALVAAVADEEDRRVCLEDLALGPWPA